MNDHNVVVRKTQETAAFEPAWIEEGHSVTREPLECIDVIENRVCMARVIVREQEDRKTLPPRRSHVVHSGPLALGHRTSFRSVQYAAIHSVRGGRIDVLVLRLDGVTSLIASNLNADGD